jgi:hypothetical protein
MKSLRVVFSVSGLHTGRSCLESSNKLVGPSVSPNTEQTVKFTATVTSPTTTPTGTGTFKDGSTVLGTGTLAGKASYSTSTLSAGSHNITAVYAGDSQHLEARHKVRVQTVK